MVKIQTNQLKSEVEDFFKKVGMKVTADVEERTDDYLVDLKTEDSGLLIGHHGDTLSDFQTVLSLILNRKYSPDDWTRFIFDIDGWKLTREESLRNLTLKAIEKVRATGEPYTLPPMRPAERRVIHMIVGENTDIASESSGEGSSRRVVLSLK